MIEDGRLVFLCLKLSSLTNYSLFFFFCTNIIINVMLLLQLETSKSPPNVVVMNS